MGRCNMNDPRHSKSASDHMRERARLLRRDSTIPERILWKLLRDRRLSGAKFRRQHPVGPYVVDFYCPSHGLVVELDGRSHDDHGLQDQERERYLESTADLRYCGSLMMTCCMIVKAWSSDFSKHWGLRLSEWTGRGKEIRVFPHSRAMRATRRPRPNEERDWVRLCSCVIGSAPSPGLRPTSPRGGEVKKSASFRTAGR